MSEYPKILFLQGSAMDVPDTRSVATYEEECLLRPAYVSEREFYAIAPEPVSVSARPIGDIDVPIVKRKPGRPKKTYDS